MQSRCCVNDCFLNNSSNAHAHYLLLTLNGSARSYFTAAFTVYMENSLRYEILPKRVLLRLNSCES